MYYGKTELIMYLSKTCILGDFVPKQGDARSRMKAVTPNNEASFYCVSILKDCGDGVLVLHEAC